MNLNLKLWSTTIALGMTAMISANFDDQIDTKPPIFNVTLGELKGVATKVATRTNELYETLSKTSATTVTTGNATPVSNTVAATTVTPSTVVEATGSVVIGAVDATVITKGLPDVGATFTSASVAKACAPDTIPAVVSAVSENIFSSAFKKIVRSSLNAYHFAKAHKTGVAVCAVGLVVIGAGSYVLIQNMKKNKQKSEFESNHKVC